MYDPIWYSLGNHLHRLEADAERQEAIESRIPEAMEIVLANLDEDESYTADELESMAYDLACEQYDDWFEDLLYEERQRQSETRDDWYAACYGGY